MHLVANQLITLSGDRAVSEAYGIAYHRSSNPDPRRNLTVGFRYVDLVERRSDHTWRIAERVELVFNAPYCEELIAFTALVESAATCEVDKPAIWEVDKT
jgi:hypothetical protein